MIKFNRVLLLLEGLQIKKRFKPKCLKRVVVNPCLVLVSFSPLLPLVHIKFSSYHYLADLHLSIENSINFFGINKILVDFMLLICKTAK